MLDARIAALEPETIAICAYGALIKEPLLSEHQMLNVHPSLLPRWRGAAPVERAIEAGDEETGVSIMRPTAEFDAGPVGVERAEAIRPDDNYGTLAPRLAALGGELLVEALDLEPAFRDQPDTRRDLRGEDPAPRTAVLDPDLGADLLERRVRALTPHIGAYIELPWDERLGVTRAALASGGDGPPRRAARRERRSPPIRRRDRRARTPGGASRGKAPDGRRGLDPRIRGAARPMSR